MTPALREELLGLRRMLATVDARLADLLGPPTEDDLRAGKTPAAIMRLLGKMRRAMSPAEITEDLRAAGRDVSDDAVYQACCRLADAGRIKRVRPGVYVANGAAEGGS